MVNDPACSLSESSAEDELELDLFDTASQVGDSLPRLDIGCGVKKVPQVHGHGSPVSIIIHVACRKVWSFPRMQAAKRA